MGMLEVGVAANADEASLTGFPIVLFLLCSSSARHGPQSWGPHLLGTLALPLKGSPRLLRIHALAPHLQNSEVAPGS